MNVLTRRGITQTKSDRTQCVLFPFSEVEIRLHLNIRLKCSKRTCYSKQKQIRDGVPFPDAGRAGGGRGGLCDRPRAVPLKGDEPLAPVLAAGRERAAGLAAAARKAAAGARLCAPDGFGGIKRRGPASGNGNQPPFSIRKDAAGTISPRYR